MIKRIVYWLLILVACILTPLISKRIHREDISTVIERANALCQDNPEEAMALISTYDYKRDHHMRANAYYQHALTQKQHGYDPLAILSLTGAANSLTVYSDPHLEMLNFCSPKNNSSLSFVPEENLNEDKAVYSGSFMTAGDMRSSAVRSLCYTGNALRLSLPQCMSVQP